jgi:queuosine precursor transporter
MTSTPAPERPLPAYRYFDLVMALFVTVLIVSNIASSAKIIDWGFSIKVFGATIPIAFDGGTILFPIAYIFGDVLTEVYGYRRSRRVIWTGFFCLGLSALILWIVQILPGTADWQQYAGQKAFDAILGGMSSGGIVLASLAAYWSGEFSNSFVLAKMKILTHGRLLWTRTIGSTLVGELVDSAIFLAIACLFNVFPWSVFLTLLLTNYVFKCTMEAVMTPVTYRVVAFLKRTEQEDYYDYHTDFNPFRA